MVMVPSGYFISLAIKCDDSFHCDIPVAILDVVLERYGVRLKHPAEQGFAEAQYGLGFIYFRGKGVTKDEAEGIRWWRKAAEQGNAKAKTELQKLGLQ